MRTEKEMGELCHALEKELFTYEVNNIEETIILQALLSRRYSEVARLNLAESGIPTVVSK